MARQKKDAKKISLNLDNHLLNQIQEYADSHRMTFTATLEMIIDEYFTNQSVKNVDDDKQSTIKNDS